MIKKVLIFLIFSVYFLYSNGQNNYSDYNFLNLRDNYFQYTDSSLYYNRLMKKFSSLCENQEEKISILHLGDSHLQAGFYSNEIRQNFQNYFTTDTLANLGMVFPYSAAKTNNPPDYTTNYSGTWKTCKARAKTKNCQTGLTGISVYTKDTSASITISLRDYYPLKNHAFNHAKLLCSYPDSLYSVEITPKGKIHSDSSSYEIAFDQLTDFINIQVKKIQPEDSIYIFKLDGIILRNSTHSLTYHEIGVNGAKASSYLHSKLFSRQLETINPDWVIISLGTNEAYNEHFNPIIFRNHLTSLIQTIQTHTDSTWILLNTPGDAMLRRKHRNPNNNRARQTIIEVAQQTQSAYWDFFHVMGASESIDAWHINNLTATDKLHLNKKGYLLKGNLFFDAFLHNYQEYVNTKNRNN